MSVLMSGFRFQKIKDFCSIVSFLEEQSEFDDVAIYFSEEEWDYLNENEKEIYREVMMDNYMIVWSLGWIHMKPTVISMIEQGVDPYIRRHKLNNEKEVPIYTSSGETQSSMTPKGHHISVRSPDYLLENTGTTQQRNQAYSGRVSTSLQRFARIKAESQQESFTKTQMDKCEKPSELRQWGKCLVNRSEVVSHQIIHNSVNLTSHLVTHKIPQNREILVICHMCGKCFQDKSALLRYQDIHSAKKPFVCSDCEKRLTHSSDLALLQSRQPGQNVSSYNECDKSITSKVNLDAHMRPHTGLKLFLCSECGKGFTYRYRLYMHQKIHIEEKPFSCNECGKLFTCNQYLKKHVKIHTGQKQFPCSDCGKSLCSKASLLQHQRIHTGEKPFLCSFCERQFRHMTSLAIHEQTHTGDRPFTCFECGKSFGAYTNLLRHLKMHTLRHLCSCDEGGNSLTHETNQVAHKTTHEGLKMVTSTEREKSFSSNSVLLNYQGIHPERNPFSSSQEKTHGVEKPFKCADCGHSFTAAASLTAHQRLHKREKPYTCSDCGNVYSVKSNFVKHQKIHCVESVRRM